MSHYVMVPEAHTLVEKLVRAWTTIHRVAPFRASARKTRLIEAALAYIVDVVNEYYDIPAISGPDTSVSMEAYRAVAREELVRLIKFEERLVATEYCFAPLPEQSEMRRVLVGTALSAYQYTNAPQTSVAPGGFPDVPLTHGRVVEA